MKRYEIEIAKRESRTPLFYYPYYIKLISNKAKNVVAKYFYGMTTSYVLSFREHMVEGLLTDENLSKLSGEYVFHYNDLNETEGERIALVKHAAPKVAGHMRIDGFHQFHPNTKHYGANLEDGIDFEVIVGERVEIEKSVKLTFDDIPDLMGVNE